MLKQPMDHLRNIKGNEKNMLCYAKSLQSCLTLCDPIDGSPPGSPVPGILQARTLEWVAISFSNAWKWKVKVKLLSCVRLLATPWTVAYQAPPSMGFSRQEYWSGVPLPSPEKAYLETNEIMMIQNLWDVTKAVLRRKYIVIKSYLSKEEKSQMNNLILFLKQ